MATSFFASTPPVARSQNDRNRLYLAYLRQKGKAVPSDLHLDGEANRWYAGLPPLT